MLLDLNGETLELDPTGALWWQARALLIVADLHFEKGTAFARRGALLPPYDTHATLAKLEALIARRRPKTVVSLGDGFHDRGGPRDLAPDLFDRLTTLVRAQSWLWITGNHDPCVPLELGGACLPEIALAGLTLRHAPDGIEPGEIAGHLHPKARLESPRMRRSRPAFVADRSRLVMPAFGSFTGGLNALDPAIACLFPRGFAAYMLGDAKVFRIPHPHLAPEPDAMQHRISA